MTANQECDARTCEVLARIPAAGTAADGSRSLLLGFDISSVLPCYTQLHFLCLLFAVLVILVAPYCCSYDKPDVALCNALWVCMIHQSNLHLHAYSMTEASPLVYAGPAVVEL